MELTYGQLELTLRTHLKIHPDKAMTLRSRIKQLQRLPVPFPPGINVGKGTRMLYTAEHLLQLATAFELLSFGLPPQPACQLILDHWEKFSGGFALAALQDRRPSAADASDIYAVVQSKSMNDIQFGWNRKHPSDVNVLDEGALLSGFRMNDFNRSFTKLVVNLTGLTKNVLKIASDTAGVKYAGTWADDFHAWLPKDEAYWISFHDYYPDRSNLKMRQRLHMWHGNDPDASTPEGAEEARIFAEDENYGAVPF